MVHIRGDEENRRFEPTGRQYINLRTRSWEDELTKALSLSDNSGW